MSTLTPISVTKDSNWWENTVKPGLQTQFDEVPDVYDNFIRNIQLEQWHSNKVVLSVPVHYMVRLVSKLYLEDIKKVLRDIHHTALPPVVIVLRTLKPHPAAAKHDQPKQRKTHRQMTEWQKANLEREKAEATLQLNATMVGAAVSAQTPTTVTPVESTAEHERKTLASVVVYSYTFPIPLELIAEVVANEHGIALSDLLSDKRGEEYVVPRKIAFWLASVLTARTVQQIGIAFGGRDDQRARTYIRCVEGTILSDPSRRETLKRLQQLIVATWQAGNSAEVTPRPLETDVTLERIRQVVCKRCHLSADQLNDKKADHFAVRARYIVCWLASKLNVANDNEIAKFIGATDAYSVDLGRSQIEYEKKNNDYLRTVIDAMLTDLQS